VGSDNIDRTRAGMGAEDFAYMQQKAPGTMISVGAAYDDMKRGRSYAGVCHQRGVYAVGRCDFGRNRLRRFLAGEVK
jgi:amidohydrolase